MSAVAIEGGWYRGVARARPLVKGVVRLVLQCERDVKPTSLYLAGGRKFAGVVASLAGEVVEDVGEGVRRRCLDRCARGTRLQRVRKRL